MGIVRRTLCLPRIAAWIRPYATLLAFCVALIWLVHPIQTESVTYIVQRLESMMGMFFLGSLYCLLRGATGGRNAWYFGSIACAGLALGTKEVGLMIAPVALLYHRAFWSESWREVLKRRGLVHVAIAVAVIGYFAVQIGDVPFHSERPDAAGRRPTSWEYLRSAARCAPALCQVVVSPPVTCASTTFGSSPPIPGDLWQRGGDCGHARSGRHRMDTQSDDWIPDP